VPIDVPVAVSVKYKVEDAGHGSTKGKHAHLISGRLRGLVDGELCVLTLASLLAMLVVQGGFAMDVDLGRQVENDASPSISLGHHRDAQNF